MSEYINEVAAHNWQTFSRQQYFDSNGLFISTVFCIPLLLNCMILIVKLELNIQSISLMTIEPFSEQLAVLGRPVDGQSEDCTNQIRREAAANP